MGLHVAKFARLIASNGEEKLRYATHITPRDLFGLMTWHPRILNFLNGMLTKSFSFLTIKIHLREPLQFGRQLEVGPRVKFASYLLDSSSSVFRRFARSNLEKAFLGIKLFRLIELNLSLSEKENFLKDFHKVFQNLAYE